MADKWYKATGAVNKVCVDSLWPDCAYSPPSLTVLAEWERKNKQKKKKWKGIISKTDCGFYKNSNRERPKYQMIKWVVFKY